MPNTYLVWLRSPRIPRAAQPGQFVMVQCGGEYDPLLRRPLSIHRVDKRRIALLYDVVGRGTRWLSQRRRGDSLDLLGPLGNGFAVYPDSRSLLLVAGGMGIVPLVSLAEKALSRGQEVRLLLGARTAGQLYPVSMLPPQVDSIVVTEDGSAGEKGVVTEFVPDLIARADQVFACGPLSMYRVMASQGQTGDKSVQVSLETGMGCGLGVCYGCTVKTRDGLKQVCKDGPVFELQDILWEEMPDLS